MASPSAACKFLLSAFWKPLTGTLLSQSPSVDKNSRSFDNRCVTCSERDSLSKTSSGKGPLSSDKGLAAIGKCSDQDAQWAESRLPAT